MCAELDFSRGIWAAARDGEEDKIRHLLSRFLRAANAPCPLILTSLSVYHFYCCNALKISHRSVFQLIFHSRGTDASQRDNGGYTGLHYAARSGHLHVVRLLLQVLQMFISYLVGT